MVSFRHSRTAGAVGAIARVLMAITVGVACVSCGSDSSSPTDPMPPVEGAVFRVAVADEIYHVLLRDPEKIAEAEALIAAGSSKLVFGRLARGDAGFNQPWSWHLVPQTVEFGDVCAGEYDARPSTVEANLDQWVDEVMFLCPWGSDLVSRVR